MTFFGYVLTILAWTKCRLVTKHAHSITHFHSCFFFTFPIKFYLYRKFKLSIKDYLFLIYTFMCMIIFLRIIMLSFQSHQTRILSAGLGMAWNRYGLSWIVFFAYPCFISKLLYNNMVFWIRNNISHFNVVFIELLMIPQQKLSINRRIPSRNKKTRTIIVHRSVNGIIIDIYTRSI